jgi:hypothetical protein
VIYLNIKILFHIGVVGVGIIIDFRGKFDKIYEWGLSNSSNNQVKVYVLLHDLHFAIDHNL